MTNWQKILLSIVAALGIGYSFGRYAVPGKMTIQTKETEHQVVVVQHDTVTETHQVKKPDGTVITDITTKDKDTDKTNTTETSQSKETISNAKPQWRVQGLVGVSTANLAQPLYGVGIERRILGPISAGAWGLTSPNGQTGGLSLSIEF